MAKFCAFGRKTIKIWNFWENFKICIQRFQWKIDCLPIFSPIFHDFCHFLHICNILKKIFGMGRLAPGLVGTFEFGGIGGLYKSPILTYTIINNSDVVMFFYCRINKTWSIALIQSVFFFECRSRNWNSG